MIQNPKRKVKSALASHSRGLALPIYGHHAATILSHDFTLLEGWVVSFYHQQEIYLPVTRKSFIKRFILVTRGSLTKRFLLVTRRSFTKRFFLVTKRILTVRPRDPLLGGGGVKMEYVKNIFLGHWQMSGQI